MRLKNRIKKILLVLIFGLISYCLPSEKIYSQPVSLNPEYITLIQQKIISYCMYPPKAKEKGWEGTTKVRFTLTGDGRIKQIDIAESSEHSLLDAAAILAVKDASPFPAFKPYLQDSKEEEIELQAELVFQKPSQEKPRTLKKAVEQLIEPKAVEKARKTTAAEEKPPSKELSEEKASPEKIGNLESLLHLALQNYQPAKIAKEQVELAQLKILKAGRDLFPTLAAQWTNVKGKTITDPYRSKSYGIQGEQTIFDSGKLMYAFRREKLGLQIAKKNYDQVTSELIYKVRKSYYELAGAQETLKNLNNAKKKCEQDLGLVSKQYAAGLITKIELLSTYSKYERLGYLIDSAEADLAVAKVNLQQAVNLDSLEDLPEEVSLDLNVKKLKINLKEVQELAQKSRADIQSLELGDLSAKYAEMIAARENRPKITISGSKGKSGESFIANSLELTDEWSIMAKVSFLFGGSTVEASQTKDKTLPKTISDTTLKTEANTSQVKFSLLNNLAYYTDRKEAQVAHKQITSQLHESRQKADLEVENAYMTYQKALSLLNTSLSDKNFREGELKVNLMRRDVGELPTSEVMQSRIEVAQAQSNYIQAASNYYLAIASLNKAVGISNYYR